HANFAEHTPLALLLIGLVEAFGYPALAVNGLGVVLLLARLLSAFGLNSTLKQSLGRQSGASLTVLVTAVSAAVIIYAVIPHFYVTVLHLPCVTVSLAPITPSHLS